VPTLCLCVLYGSQNKQQQVFAVLRTRPKTKRHIESVCRSPHSRGYEFLPCDRLFWLGYSMVFLSRPNYISAWYINLHNHLFLTHLVQFIVNWSFDHWSLYVRAVESVIKINQEETMNKADQKLADCLNTLRPSKTCDNVFVIRIYRLH
jgi:hypothetical protein